MWSWKTMKYRFIKCCFSRLPRMQLSRDLQIGFVQPQRGCGSKPRVAVPAATLGSAKVFYSTATRLRPLTQPHSGLEELIDCSQCSRNGYVGLEDTTALRLRNAAARVFAVLAAVFLPLSISALSNQTLETGLHQRPSSGFSATATVGQQPAAPPRTVQSANDPAAWGGNHIGRPIPEYVHGDECLFCHRNDIGTTWQKNAHGVTVRQGEDAPVLQALVRKQPALSHVANEIEYFLGSRHRVRFLKKDGYGKFALLNAQAVLGPDSQVDKWIDADKLSWDKERFGNRCAGCHATAVDSTAKTFAAFGLDCYACHGDVTLEHTKDTSLIWLSRKRRDDARAITSICAQCHLRLGKSRSTGLPYPNTFIAGDNLFQDYEVDFSKADDESLNPGDRHILRNVRDVVLRGQLVTTCLTCHQVHENSSAKHRAGAIGPICGDCHVGRKLILETKPYVVHNSLCEY